MATRTVLSTRVLLVCAAIGVATGLLSAVAGWLSVPLWALYPLAVLYGLVLGVHVVPGIIAQELLRLPWVALITHVVAALVATAFSPQWAMRYLGVAVLIGGLQEGIAALTRYRVWKWWRFMVSGVVVGLVLAGIMWLVFDLARFETWAQVAFVAVLFVGPIAWTGVALAIGAGLRRAGVARGGR
ncbi:MAG: ECF transporter S component [Microbacterium sp.]|uniref:ECF transporter S component n=1 Tax=Microbacterium sp. TaxID=51671 RepID=UPI0039E465CA